MDGMGESRYQQKYTRDAQQIQKVCLAVVSLTFLSSFSSENMQVKRLLTYNEAMGVQTGKQHCCSPTHKSHTLRLTNKGHYIQKKRVKFGNNSSLTVEVFVTFFGGEGVLN